MDSELLSVKWNDHRKTFIDVLATSREEKKFCDVTIACGGNLYPVHRFVISTCSTYFEKILESINNTHPVIVLADIKPKLFEDLLQYMYVGVVKVLQKDVAGLIKAGEDLKIKGFGGIGVTDENAKDKNEKRTSNDSEGRPQKRQRNDECSKLNASCREPKDSNEAIHSSESLNEGTCQNVHEDSLDPEFTAVKEEVKEEVLQPNADSSYFHEHGLKEELCESAMNEDNSPAIFVKFQRTSKITEEDLRKCFSQFGMVVVCNIKQGKLGFVEFLNADAANKAIKQNGKLRIKGDILQIKSDRINDKDLMKMAQNFKMLSTTPGKSNEAKRILLQMKNIGNICIKKKEKHGRLELLEDGKLITTALQNTPSVPEASILEYEDVMAVADKPASVFLQMSHNGQNIGQLIIQLDNSCPRKSQHFHQLCSGNNDKSCSWLGAGFTSLVDAGRPIEEVRCRAYRDGSFQRQCRAMFQLEGLAPQPTPRTAGRVYGGYGEWDPGFFITTRTHPGDTTGRPLIGQVTSGLSALQAVMAQGDAYVKDITFTQCGLVIGGRPAA